MKGQYVFHGYFYFLQQARKSHLDAGSAFDFAMMPVFDGLVGGAYAKVYETMRANVIVSDGSLKVAVVTSATTAVNNVEEACDEGKDEKSQYGEYDDLGLEIRDDFQLINIDSA